MNSEYSIHFHAFSRKSSKNQNSKKDSKIQSLQIEIKRLKIFFAPFFSILGKHFQLTLFREKNLFVFSYLSLLHSMVPIQFQKNEI